MKPTEPMDLFPVERSAVDRLRARLASASAEAGLLDVAYRVIDSPLGPLLIAATPEGLVRVAFAAEGQDGVLQGLADRISPRVLAAPARLDAAARQFDEYFAGRLRRFELALDWQLSKGFRRTALERLTAEVGYGSRTTYGALARLSGSPGAVRATGTACATNPIPLVVPCHRVVRSDGAAGSYRGGAEAKLFLLDLEERARRGGA